MTDWTFADLWELIAATRPDDIAMVRGARHLSWADFDRRADGVAAALLASGAGHQAKVAQYLYNTPEYLESIFAAFKVGMVPLNTNYRYSEGELLYLWDNADAEVVVFDAEFSERIEAIRDRLPGVRLWLRVGGDPAACPTWARSYEVAAAGGATGPVRARWGRSGDDLLLVYTGGTTGMPKGVMWRQDDLFVVLNRTASLRYDPAAGLEGVASTLAVPPRHPPSRMLPGPPLMHGTGLFTAISVLDSAGRIVMTEQHRFDAVAMLDTIEAAGVTEVSIVGDAFARPILAALDATPGRWDLGSLWLMISSGVIWSAAVKDGLSRHLPHLRMVDSLGSSEAIGVASSNSGGGGTSGTAAFHLGPDTRVITDDGRDVVPGSGQTGLVAVSGRGPTGYYKDEAKSAATFRIIDGERWTVPGDVAEIGADGSIRLLGRGSAVVNTGGEKVFPEEVEEVIKLHEAVHDAVVVGVPDDRFGEVVVAVVENSLGGAVDLDEVAAWVRRHLAAYKAPRHLVEVDTIGRAPNGKVDYRRLRALAADRLGVVLPA